MNDSPNEIHPLFEYYFHKIQHLPPLHLNTPRSVSDRLRQGATIDPVTFIPLLEKITTTREISDDYAHAIARGVIEHFRYRLHDSADTSGHPPITLFPDLTDLAKVISDWPEQFDFIRNDEGLTSDIVGYCCRFPEKLNHIDRLIMALFRLAGHPDPLPVDPGFDVPYDIDEVSDYSIRGKTAQHLMILIRKRRLYGLSSSGMISPLLYRFATDVHPSVRLSILKHLPVFSQEDPEKAWKLFNAVFQRNSRQLWPFCEPFLACRYNKEFEKVKPVLDRMTKESGESMGKTWGRIMTLGFLDDKISADRLFYEFGLTASEAHWMGFFSVLDTHIFDPERYNKCHNILFRFVNSGMLTPNLSKRVEYILYRWVNDAEMAHVILSLHAITACYAHLIEHGDLSWFYRKLSGLYEKMPSLTLQIVENVLMNIQGIDTPASAYHQKQIETMLIDLKKCR